MADLCWPGCFVRAGPQWAKANIHRFGGDEREITIAGESAGAEAVCNLLVSPVAKGLFKRAVIESGPCITGTHGW
eukprot:SAG22_NODE_358_length_11759_cov_39.384563_8_plen_75_part_00